MKIWEVIVKYQRFFQGGSQGSRSSSVFESNMIFPDGFFCRSLDVGNKNQKRPEDIASFSGSRPVVSTVLCPRNQKIWRVFGDMGGITGQY